MSQRQTPLPGMSYAYANAGRIMTFAEDVLGYKRQIEERWSELSIFWDDESEEWVIVETDKVGSQSLVFATKALGQSTIDRLERADNHRSDAFDEIESWNAKMEKEQDYRNAEMIHEVGEKLAWAIRKDELDGPAPRVYFNGDYHYAGV